MCGIAGILYRDPARDLATVVEQAVAAQLSRGPDFQAVEAVRTGSPTVVFGHNRLSIIDLSAEANQPMWDAERRCCLVFNGEIYNYLEIKAELQALGHVFHTASDSEVLIEAYKAWGPDAVQRFNGMFAFGLYDRQHETLWLCRDRFGVKPLYYRAEPDMLAFASTGKPLARAFGLGPDLGYLARGLAYWVYEDGSDQTQYEGLKCLRPGHSLFVRLDGPFDPAPTRYYDLKARVLPLRDELAGLAIEPLAARVEAALDNAITLRLRSDVPLGLTLSGGLDSSTIAAFTTKHAHAITGFTYGSPTDQESEGPLVEALRQRLGIDVHYVHPDNDALVAGFWRTLEAQDAPFTRGSQVAEHLVYQAARQAGMRVLMGGQGADESFLGYRKFQLFRFRQLLAERRYGSSAAFLVGLLPLLVAEVPKLGLYWQHRSRYGGEKPTSVLRLPPAAPLDLGTRQQDYFDRQLMDFTRFSLPTLLRYEDRNSMGNSIESRLPFLDYRLVELAFALPDQVKVQRGYGKWILRQVGAGHVPDEIRLARYKRGFDVSQHDWIRHGLGTAIRQTLAERAIALSDVLPAGAKLDELYSDDNLCHRLPAMAEVTTLLWLAR